MQINHSSVHVSQNISSLSLDQQNRQPSWKTESYRLFHHAQDRLHHSLSNFKMPKISVAIASKVQDKISVITSFLAPYKPLESLPRDNNLLLKKLDNGFTYYVRKNSHPFPQKAYLRLVVRVGMLNETPQEKGIAHMIEHIAQTETENFPKDQIMNYLSSKGVHWGRDNNAYTAPEETVYKLDIPLDDPETLDKCLLILSEVASKAILSEDIINNEREIVVDELSQRRNAWTRYNNAKRRLTCEGTPYAELVDSDKEIKSVKQCPADIIQAFYKRWYRPENMAIIAVGDFDALKTSALIEKHFGTIPTSNLSPSKHDYQIKENRDTRFFCFSDLEMPYSPLEIIHHLPKLKYSNELQEEQISLAISMFKSLFKQRLENLSEEENSPFIDVGCSTDDLIPGSPSFKLQAIAKEGEIPKAFRQLLLEIKRIKAHGFLQSEFDRVKKAILATIDHTIQEKDKRGFNSFINLYHSHFIEGEVISDIEKMVLIAKQLIEKTSLKDVNALASYLLPDKNRLISTAAPQKPGVEPITEDILKQEIAFAESEKVLPLVDEIIDQPLMKRLPKPGKISSSKLHQRANVTEYTLKNGMRVFVKPTTFKKDEIKIKAYSLDGTRSAGVKARASAKFSNSFFDACGIGDFDNKTLDKVLNGKQISFKASVGTYTTTIRAGSVLKDIETIFQLIHLMFINPGYDRAAFERTLRKTEEIYRNQENSPSKVFSKEIISTITQDHPEFKPLAFEDLKSIDYETCKNFHQKKFSNPADFTVAIVGNIQSEKIKGLIERYFGSLAKPHAKQAALNYSPTPFPPGITHKTVHAGKETNGTSLLTFPAPINDTIRERLLSNWCCDILELRLNKVLRFEGGKTYSQSCSFANTIMPGLNPKNPSTALISLTGDPAVHKDLEKLLIKQILDMQTQGPTESEINDYKISTSKAYSNQMKTNLAWIESILASSIWNKEQNYFDVNEQELDLLTSTEARDHFRKIFPIDNYAVVTLAPSSLS
ncbi:MAG: insulinase family protein [Parachlamydiaceae bacterium]|nr:insulinase family protein [Parachlamydiaceae bacterium]